MADELRVIRGLPAIRRLRVTRGLRAQAALWLSAALLSGCGYSSLQQQDEQVRTSWSEVVNQFQRRAELVTSLTMTMQSVMSGDAALLGAAQSRARSESLAAAAAALNDPAAFASYQSRQEQLADVLGGLMGASATDPRLEMDANFRDLRSQLVETEAHLSQARDRYVAAARTFNTALRSFPTDLTARVFDFRPKPDLAGASIAPLAPVDVHASVAPAAAAAAGARLQDGSSRRSGTRMSIASVRQPFR